MWKIKYILFDVDGVLLHSPTWSSEFIEKNHLPSDIMSDFFTWVFKECIIGKADLKVILPSFLERWGYEKWVEAFLKEWFDFENSPDRELIEKIQERRKDGVKCFIATNQEKYRLNYMKKSMDFEKLFDGIFASCEIGYKKPQKEYYEYIVSFLKVNPEEILYFDDSLENVTVARSMGMETVLYKNIADFTQTHFSCI